MAETVFDNISIRGTLAVVGTFAAAVLTATTITASTSVTTPSITNSSGSFILNNSGLDVTTKSVQATTLSGVTIRSTDGTSVMTNALVESTTISGATLRSTDGLASITNSLVESPTLSGSTVLIRKNSAGTGTILVEGTTGTAFCFRNTAGTLKVITIVTATLTVRDAVASDGCGS